MPKPISDTEWTQIHSLIANTGPILEQQRKELSALTSELAALERRRCTGKAHWRDLRDSHKKPKLYVIHATDTPCPLHGKPVTGARIRTYVGTNPAKKQRAINAMQNNEAYKTLQAEHDRLDGRIRSLIYMISRTYWTLGLDIPEPPQDKPDPQQAEPTRGGCPVSV